MQAKQAGMAGKAAATNKVEGERFLAANKNNPGVTTLPSGLQYKVLKQGTGPKPRATDTVTVHYEGKLIDGTVFDSSLKRGEPTSFAVNQVIPGWTEALQLMPVGSTWQLFIPSNLAYGEHPRPGGPIGPECRADVRGPVDQDRSVNGAAFRGPEKQKPGRGEYQQIAASLFQPELAPRSATWGRAGARGMCKPARGHEGLLLVIGRRGVSAFDVS